MAQAIRDRIIFNPIFWGGTFAGYYSMYGMGHFEHGILWVLLGIVPFVGLVFSLTPHFTKDSFYKAYAQSLGIQGDERIIDFGCGSGLLSRQIANLLPRGHLTCIDINSHAIASTKKRLGAFSNFDLKLEDIRNLPEPTKPYGVVVSQLVLHDITPQDREKTINALTKWLDEGAVFHIREPKGCINIDELRKQLKKEGFEETKSMLVKVPFTVNFYGIREIEQLRFIYHRVKN